MGETLFTKLQLMSAIKDNSHYINNGSNSSCHSIPDNNQYVLLINTSGKEYNVLSEISQNEISPIEDKLDGRNFGQPKYQIGERIKILIKQNGNPVGKSGKNKKSLSIEETRKLYTQQSKVIAALPDEAYEKIMEDLNFLREKNYKIDPSKSNNLLFDEERQSLGFVDVSPFKGSKDDNTQCCPIYLAHMLCPGGYLEDEDDIYKKETQPLRQQIIEKTLRAAEKMKCPTSRAGDSMFNATLKSAGFNDEKIQEINQRFAAIKPLEENTRASEQQKKVPISTIIPRNIR